MEGQEAVTERVKPRGTCSVCRANVAVTMHGLAYPHLAGFYGTGRCTGSRQPAASMVMTPQEIADAWRGYVFAGDGGEAFERMLDQLWSGELVMEFPEGGTIIRARRPSDPPPINPRADQPRPRPLSESQTPRPMQ